MLVILRQHGHIMPPIIGLLGAAAGLSAMGSSSTCVRCMPIQPLMPPACAVLWCCVAPSPAHLRGGWPGDGECERADD